MALERLQKILSNAGVASRRKAEQLIVEGHVEVNGELVTELGSRADFERDRITVDGVLVNRQPHRYLAVNKPRGVVTTAHDERDRPTIMQMLGSAGRGLHPVGRLDMDSEGLLIVTSDGTLTQRLTHPSHEVEKEYLVRLDKPLGRVEREKMMRGVEIDGETLLAHRIMPVENPYTAPGIPDVWLAVTLREGHKREIRRLMAHAGRNVRTLQRVRIGPLALGDIEPGTWRTLTPVEVDRLYMAATLKGRQRKPRT